MTEAQITEYIEALRDEIPAEVLEQARAAVSEIMGDGSEGWEQDQMFTVALDTAIRVILECSIGTGDTPEDEGE